MTDKKITIDDLDEVYFCEHCGKLLNFGLYYIEYGEHLFCANQEDDHCLNSYISFQEYVDQYEEDENQSYYTEYYPFYETAHALGSALPSIDQGWLSESYYDYAEKFGDSKNSFINWLETIQN